MRRFSYTYGELCSRLLSKAAPIKSYIVASTLSSIIGNLSHMGLMGSGALMLLSAAADASAAFERLPLDEHISILRNVLYSGIWLHGEHRKGKGK